MGTLSVLTPEVSVRLSGGATVAVREMSWPKARLFLTAFAALGNSLGEAIRNPGSGGTLADVGAGILGRLPELVSNSADLSDRLVEGCVADIASGKVRKDDLPASDFMRLLDASLEVTFNEEMMRLGKAVAGRVKTVIAPATPSTTTSRSGSIASSPVAGPTETSAS